MNEVNTLQADLQTVLETVVPDWDAFKGQAGLQYGSGEAQTEESDRTWFAWQVFRGEHRANSCLLDRDGRVLGLIIKDTELKALKLPALSALQYLCICNNKKLAKLEFGGGYPALQHIDLEGNGLQELDLCIDLPRLEYLNISKNQLGVLELSPSLPALQELDASANQLKQCVLPGELSALRYLFLNGNGMESLETTSYFPQLRTLHLKDNQLRTLPKGNFDLLETLYVQGNPLEAFEEALIAGDSSGNAVEISAQMRSIAISGEQPNYRAKLVIVGNGRVGKTCLIKRLSGQPFNAHEVYTHGVVISDMDKRDFSDVKTDKLYLKVWDFGGQEVFYATHQFFMSEEALYVYAWTDKAIAERNQQNDLVKSPNHRWRRHEYWLDNVRMHSKNSPLLVVKTHHAESGESFPDDLGKKYQIGPSLNFDAKSYDSIYVDRLRQAITEALNALPLLGSSFPKNYYDLMEAIAAYRKMGKEEISRADFDALAAKQKIPEKDCNAALSYLHKTGEVIYFNKEGLKEKVYINPVTLTKRLYKLIEGNDVLEKERGVFDTAYAEQIFEREDWRELLGLLESFGLVFHKPGEEGSYIAPQYLPDLSDSEKVHKAERKSFDAHQTSQKLRFSLYYPSILPENVMVNLLCVFGPYAVDLLYRNAIFFKLTYDSNGCVIRTDEEKRLVEVFTGTDPEGDSLAKAVFEKFKELSKKTEIHVAVEKDKWVKISNLEDKKIDYYATTDGNDTVKAEAFRFLTDDRQGDLVDTQEHPINSVTPQPDNMTPEELKKNVRDLISRAKTAEAIQVFKTWTETQELESLLNCLLVLESDWKTLQYKVLMNIISNADENLKRNQIVNSLLGYLGEVGELRPMPSSKEPTAASQKERRGELMLDDYYPKGPQIITVSMDASINKSALQDIPKPVKLLFLAATPKHLGQINIGKESRFKDLIEKFDKADRFDFKDEHGLGKEDFRNLLFTQKPHIIHFAGHGHYEGLSLEDSDIDTDVLVDLIGLLPNTQLIVLNACNTLSMAKAMAKYVPYVIGTQGPLDDDAAIAFARSFYVGIANGDEIESSFKFALNGIKAAKAGSQNIPVLVKGIKEVSDTLATPDRH